MLQDELYRLLKSTGLDVYFYQTGKCVNPPYIVYFREGSTAWGSDDHNFMRKDSYIVELYTAEQDAEQQGKLEVVLDSVGIDYKTSESHMAEEHIYMVAFYFDITRKV